MVTGSRYGSKTLRHELEQDTHHSQMTEQSGGIGSGFTETEQRDGTESPNGPFLGIWAPFPFKSGEKWRHPV